MPFIPDPQKQKNIAAIEKLLKDNNLEYDITLVTDSDILVSIAVMPRDYVEAISTEDNI
jgi:hypothetical protein|tara:strand:+ start:1313 stop:1489 length:177 start_codon:yes stop_codon:yes gene_type:complete